MGVFAGEQVGYWILSLMSAMNESVTDVQTSLPIIDFGETNGLNLPNAGG